MEVSSATQSRRRSSSAYSSHGSVASQEGRQQPIIGGGVRASASFEALHSFDYQDIESPRSARRRAQSPSLEAVQDTPSTEHEQTPQSGHGLESSPQAPPRSSVTWASDTQTTEAPRSARSQPSQPRTSRLPLEHGSRSSTLQHHEQKSDADKRQSHLRDGDSASDRSSSPEPGGTADQSSGGRRSMRASFKESRSATADAHSPRSSRRSVKSDRRSVVLGRRSLLDASRGGSTRRSIHGSTLQSQHGQRHAKFAEDSARSSMRGSKLTVRFDICQGSTFAEEGSGRTAKALRRGSAAVLQKVMGANYDAFHLQSAIREWAMFNGCEPAIIHALSRCVVQDAYEAGQEIVRKGRSMSSLLIVIRGLVDVDVDGVAVHKLTTGQYAGEVGWLDVESMWTCTLKAHVNCIIGSISRHKLLQAVEESPDFLDWDQVHALKSGWVSNNSLRGTISLFDGLAEEALNALSRLPVTKIVFEGETMMEEGEVGNELYIVHAGKVVVEIAGREVSSFDVQVKPVCFGELGLIGLQKTRSATVTARSLVLARVLYREAMLQTLQIYHETLKMDQVTSTLSERFAGLASAASRSNRLKEVDMFRTAGCSSEFLSFLASHLEGVVLLIGQHVVDENSDDKCMYFLTHGAVKVMKDGQEVARMKKGAVFGETVMLGIAEKRSASVIATETCYAEKLHQCVLIRGLELFPSDRNKVFATVRMQTHGEKRDQEDDFVSMFRNASKAFESLDDTFLTQLSQHAVDRIFLPGECITEEGRPGHSMFLLVTGQAGIFCLQEQRSCGVVTRAELQKKAVLKQGDTFGELAMLGVLSTRAATIKAESMCLMWEIHQEPVRGILSEFPEARRVFVPLILKSLESSSAHRFLSLHMLRNFDRNFKMLLGFECQRRVYFPKEVIAKGESPGEGLYIFNVGEAVVSTNNVAICTLRAGSYFGANIMLGMQKKMICTLTASAVCHVLIVTHESYSTALMQYPALEASQALHRSEHEAFVELQQSVKQVQMRSNIATRIIHSLGYAGAQSQMETMQILEETFKGWLDYVESMVERREAERKTSLRLWKQQLWILEKRKARYLRVQQEVKTIQHVWPPRGGDDDDFRQELSTPHFLPSLDTPRGASSRPANAADQVAWSQQVMLEQGIQSARETGYERQRAWKDMYLAPTGRQTSRQPPSLAERRVMENMLFQRNVLSGILDGV